MNLFHLAILRITLERMTFVQLCDKKLKVSNIGNPLKMEPLKMFEWFSKVGAVENSSGLGLSIVKKVLSLLL